MFSNMNTGLSATELDDLKKIVDACDFLQLTTSQDQYPNSKGTGLPLLVIKTTECSAVIALQGAHLLEFSATNKPPLLWLSPNCEFSEGVALRGGVPVCLPWFGVNEQDKSKPKHGFARNVSWLLKTANLLSTGAVELVFIFSSKANDLFAFDFAAELKITLSNNVKLNLSIFNTSDHTFECSWALHSYFAVNSLNTARATGLQNKSYIDSLDNNAGKEQQDDIHFPSEVDRIFYNISNDVGVEDNITVNIKHHNCPSVVVWNPGADNAANIKDIGAGNEQHFICVERGAVRLEQWRLAAGTHNTAWVEFSYH